MTDGLDSSDMSVEYVTIDLQTKLIQQAGMRAKIFGYVFGSGGGVEKPLAIVKNNDGLFWQIADGDDLGTYMSQ